MDKKPDEIYCTKCGSKLPSDADYCTKCGVRVAELKMSTDPGSTNIVQEIDPVEKASSEAKSWLIWSIVGFFICGIVLGPLSIANASRIKNILKPGDPNYGKAVAAQIIGWVDVVGWAIALIIGFANR